MGEGERGLRQDERVRQMEAALVRESGGFAWTKDTDCQRERAAVRGWWCESHRGTRQSRRPLFCP